MIDHEPLPGAVYIALGRIGEPAMGWAWRIWASRTSFYLKCSAPGIKHLKLSLHSHDPRHPAGGGFKIAMDTQETFEREIAQNKAIGWRNGDWPVWFPGKPIGETSTLVARFRWTWDACHRLGPAARPGELKANAVGLAVPPPTGPGDATDVDLIVSRDRPHWPNEVQARRENACIGPLRNETGDWLTAVVVKRRAGHHPAAGGAIGPRPAGREDEIRALGSALDPAGFLWLIEQRMSRSELAFATATRRD